MENKKSNSSRKGSKTSDKPFSVKKVKKVDRSTINSDVTSNDKNSKVNKNGKKKRKTGWKVFRVFLFIMIALFIIGTGVVLGVISGIIDETKNIELEDLQLLKLTTKILDKNENTLTTLSYENRVIADYKDMPQYFIDAVTSIEDERFFTHKGVDVKRTAGAVFTYIIHGGKSNFGGSTITQQLVKNTMEDDDTTWQRKVREWYRALTLEKKLNKEQIFEAYVNKIYMGDGAYGVEVAAQNYFGKSVKDINLAESAVLAAIIQSPESTNPYKSDEAKEKLIERQHLVLKQMLKLNKITEDEYNEALNYNLEFKKKENNGDTEVQSYFVDAVIEQVIEDLMEAQGISRGDAISKIYSAGYTIYSTEDPDVQKAIDNAYSNERLFYTNNDGTFMQGASVVIENSTGNVVGLIGGADEKKADRVLNRATDVPRQPGSTMKPLGAYGPAFELGTSYPAKGVDDCQLVGSTTNFGNYYGYFNGYVTAREAINKSMNLPALRTTQSVGVDYAFNFAKNCGLTHLVASGASNDKNIASLALGGLTKGATVMDMASAYSTIANGGVYIEPKLYTKVVDKDGKEVLVNNNEAKRVMKDTTAYMLTNCLRTVVTNGTGAGTITAGNMPIVGKTGNTNDDLDQWFVGFTPYYTIASWNGYDQADENGNPLKSRAIGYRKYIGSYPYTSMVTFTNIAKDISANQQVKDFDKPSGIVTAAVCRDSGLVATDACRADPRGDRTITDIFASGSVPTATCTVHKMAKICKETGKLATQYCPSEERSFITREYTPTIKTSDWGYMLPTETCNVHTKAENKDNNNNNVNVYENNNTKTNVTTNNKH